MTRDGLLKLRAQRLKKLIAQHFRPGVTPVIATNVLRPKQPKAKVIPYPKRDG